MNIQGFDYNVSLRVLNSHICSSEIVLVKAAINYSVIELTNGRRLMCAKTLKKIEYFLSEAGFLRISKSILINPVYINFIYHSQVVMRNGESFIIARRKKISVLSKVSHLITKKQL